MVDTTNARQMLEQELKAAQDDLERIDADLAALAGDENWEGKVPENHMADSGSNVYEMERLMTIRIEAQTRLEMVREALGRLEEGTYGICGRCGREIAPARLEALPFARYCIECQEIVDNEQDVTGVKPYQPLT
jgi:DnaK suppressor protein